MDLIEESFRQLYPEREFGYNTELNYSGKFKAYNANVRLIQHQRLIFNFSKSWKEVSSEIQIGLIQDTRMDSYNNTGIEKLRKIAKDLGRYLRKKGLPLVITTKGGVLMTVNEKVKRAKTFAP